MLLFANNCVGSRIYTQENVQFNHPLQWCIIKPDDMLYLIKNYRHINWHNIKFIQRCKYWKNWTSCGLLLDNKVHLWYTHYRLDKRKDYRIGHNVYKKDIEKYIKEIYQRRLDRLISAGLDKARPTFLINCYNTMYSTKVMKKFINLHGDYDIIIATTDKSLKQFERPGLKVICNEDFKNMEFIIEFAKYVRSKVKFNTGV